MRILFYCQHLLGMGHYVRSLALAKGLRNHQVFFVSGGVPIKEMPVPDRIAFHQLPPMHSDENFEQLMTHGVDDVKQQRAKKLLTIFNLIQPDVIIIELFPFGRKKFEFELIPLLEANLKNSNRAQVLCSLRDILAKKENQAKFEKRVCKLVNRYFDKILVHSDPQVQTLETSFSRIGDLEAKIYYTGYVVPENESVQKPGSSNPEASIRQAQDMPRRGFLTARSDEKPLSEDTLALENRLSIRRDKGLTQIIVSVGGGKVGYPLLKTAVEAHKILNKKRPVQMTLITGPFLCQHHRWQLDLMTDNYPYITIESFVPNLCELLRHSDISVSMAGYNTCLDVLRARTPAVLVPFNGGGNDEQSRRAEALSNWKVANVINPNDLNPRSLAAAIEATSELRPQEAKLNLAGVESTRNLICENRHEI